MNAKLLIMLLSCWFLLAGCEQYLSLSGTRDNIHGFGEHAKVSATPFPEQRQIIDLDAGRKALLIENDNTVLVLIYSPGGPSLKSTADKSLQAFLFRPVTLQGSYILSTYDDRLKAARNFANALPTAATPDPRAYALEGTADLAINPPYINAVVHLHSPGPVPPYTQYAVDRPDLEKPRPPNVFDPPLIPFDGPASLDVTFNEYPAPSLMLLGAPFFIIEYPFILIFYGGRVPMPRG